MADGRRRRGRPTRFDPAIGHALIDLVIEDDVPFVHAARRLGLCVRTVDDWLQPAEGEGAAPELAEWADRFTQPSDCASEAWDKLMSFACRMRNFYEKYKGTPGGKAEPTQAVARRG